MPIVAPADPLVWAQAYDIDLPSRVRLGYHRATMLPNVR